MLEGLEPVRRRPGMYIGGTDESALHHLFAEVIDNAMDEAVAGHATFIDVTLEADGWLTVTDNGRGMPVDPHPKFPKKSALEVIMTTLHAGGKFDSGAYETSGGLHGVGVSVVNALSERLEVEVARGQMLYRQVFERGIRSQARESSARSPTGAAPKCDSSRTQQIFGKGAKFKPARLFKMARVESLSLRRRRNPLALRAALARSREQTFRPRRCSTSPAASRIICAQDIEGKETVADQAFTGKVEKPGGHGSLEWAVAWLAEEDGFVHSYCNTIPTPDGGTHEAGLRGALLRGLKDHAERIGQAKRAAASPART